MRLIELTRYDGKPIWINPDAVSAVSPEMTTLYSEPKSSLTQERARIDVGGNAFFVKESPIEVMEALQGIEYRDGAKFTPASALP